MSLASIIREVIADALDPVPDIDMHCPYCGASADRAGGPLFYWKCPECGAFGTTWEWQQEHKHLAAVGKIRWLKSK